MTSINLEHRQVRGVNCIVFDADATVHTHQARVALLADLTMRARAARLRVEAAVLAYVEHGQVQFFGTRELGQYLANTRWVPNWTHTLDL